MKDKKLLIVRILYLVITLAGFGVYLILSPNYNEAIFLGPAFLLGVIVTLFQLFGKDTSFKLSWKFIFLTGFEIIFLLSIMLMYGVAQLFTTILLSRVIAVILGLVLVILEIIFMSKNQLMHIKQGVKNKEILMIRTVFAIAVLMSFLASLIYWELHEKIIIYLSASFGLFLIFNLLQIKQNDNHMFVTFKASASISFYAGYFLWHFFPYNWEILLEKELVITYFSIIAFLMLYVVVSILMFKNKETTTENGEAIPQNLEEMTEDEEIVTENIE